LGSRRRFRPLYRRSPVLASLAEPVVAGDWLDSATGEGQPV